jgi:hypothetical protein
VGLLIGPFVALLGLFALFVVLRGRARQRTSLYSTRRTMVEARAKERRDRALGLTIPPPTGPGPADPAAATGAPPAAAGAGPSPMPAAAPRPAWEQSPVPRAPEPAPAPPVPPTPEPAPAPPAAAAPAEEWKATMPVDAPIEPASWDTPVEPDPSSDAPVEPKAAVASAPSWTVTQPGEAPAPATEPPPSASPIESAAEAAALPAEGEAAGAGPAWSIVDTDGKLRDGSPARAQASAPEAERSWSVLPHPDQNDGGLGAGAPKASLGMTLLTYAGLVGALLVVLLGVVLMLTTSH